jgi:hypothetical protein
MTEEAQEPQKPYINVALIEKYMTEGNTLCMISLFDFAHRQMTRAEDLSRAYLAQMIVLEKRLKEARGEEPRAPIKVTREAPPMTNSRREAPDKQPGPSAGSVSKPKAPAGTAFDLGDLSDEEA